LLSNLPESLLGIWLGVGDKKKVGIYFNAAALPPKR
jgi:hypothetical protein